MDLRDGGRSNGVGERDEQRIDRFLQRFGDNLFRGIGRKRRQAILQALQRIGHVVADQIWPRCQHLTEFDVGRAKAFQRNRQPHTGRLR